MRQAGYRTAETVLIRSGCRHVKSRCTPKIGEKAAASIKLIEVEPCFMEESVTRGAVYSGPASRASRFLSAVRTYVN